MQTDIVRGDVAFGAEILTKHLIALGHHRISLLNGPRGDFESIQRAESFDKVMLAAGLTLRSELKGEGSYDYRGGYDAALRLLSLPPGQRPTAMVASNNFLALSAIEAARALGLRIPEDLALVCFDDFVLASIIDPFLTVMAQPARVLGAQAAQLLVNRLNNPRSWQPSRLVFTPELIVRRSCGAQRPAAPI